MGNLEFDQVTDPTLNNDDDGGEDLDLKGEGDGGEGDDGLTFEIKPDDDGSGGGGKSGKDEGGDDGGGDDDDMQSRIEDLERKVKAATRLNDRLLQHNRELAKAIEASANATKDVAEAIANKQDGPSLEEQLRTLRDEKRAALSEGDTNKVLDLDDRIMDIKIAIREQKAQGSKPKGSGNKADEGSTSNDDVTLSPEVEEFLASSPWFRTNRVMHAAAVAYEAELSQDPEWQDATTEEVLAEVKRYVEEQFNWQPRRGGRRGGRRGRNTHWRSRGRRNLGGVESGRFSRGKGGVTAVTLTPEEKQTAINLGIDPAEYAKQLAIIRGQGV